MTTTFETAKAGDRVWCILYGWGEVRMVDSLKDYPIAVSFRNEEIKTYTVDGLFEKQDLNQTLFWDEVVIDAPVKPMPALQVDAKVRVWSDDHIKHNRYFAGWCTLNGAIMTYDNGATSWSAAGFSAWPKWELAE